MIIIIWSPTLTSYDISQWFSLSLLDGLVLYSPYSSLSFRRRRQFAPLVWQGPPSLGYTQEGGPLESENARAGRDTWRPRNNLNGHCLNLGFPVSIASSKEWLQVVHLGGNFRKQEWESRECQGRGKASVRVCYEGRYYRQLGLNSALRFLLWKDKRLEHLYSRSCSLLGRL